VRVPPFRKCWGVPLGLKLAPAFASALSGEMVKFLTVSGIACTMYVDDCAIVGTSAADCARGMAAAEALFAWLGFRVNANKHVAPARAAKYVGYVFDLSAGTVAIGDARKAELIGLLRAAVDARACGTKDLDTLVGKLGFSGGVMRGGRAFVHRLRAAHRRAELSRSSVARLDAGALADAGFWLQQLQGSWSGSRMLLRAFDGPLPVVTAKSDASGECDGRHGWGYVFNGCLHWARWRGAADAATHIQYKELVAVAHMCDEYGPLLSGRILRCGLDNSGDVYAVNKLSSSCPAMMSLLRRIARAQCLHNFDVVAVHVNREFNKLSDGTTRWQVAGDLQRLLPDGVELPPLSDAEVCHAPLRCAATASSG